MANTTHFFRSYDISIIRLAILSLLISMVHVPELLAQNKEIPLNEALKNSSKKISVKLGAKTLNNTFKIRIGDHTMAKSKIKTDYSGHEKFLGVPIENSYSSTFSTFLASKAKDTAYIDAASNLSKKETNEVLLFNYFVVRDYELITDENVSSVFIHTNLKPEEHWLLLMSKTEGSLEYSLKNMSFTNGDTEINLKAIESDPFGMIMKSPSRALEFYMENKCIGALQYKSGGETGYKQYAWISDELTPQLQLVLKATFSAILELCGGASVYYFVK